MPKRTSVHPVLRRTALLTAQRLAIVAAGAFVAMSTTPALGVLHTSDTGRPHVTRAERIIDRYDCWNGTAPKGDVPAHAVVALPGRIARRVPADVGFGIWHDGDPGVLYAFCR